MTENVLKLVILFDPEVQGYKRAAHNLTAGEAITRFGDISEAKIIDQGRHHRQPDHLKCRTCQSAALIATRKHNEFSRAERAAEEPAASATEADEETMSPRNS